MKGNRAVSWNEIVTGVNEIMVREFEIEEELLQPDAHLGETLGLDSLDGVDLVVAIERRFGLRIKEDEARAMLRLLDIYETLQKRLHERPEECPLPNSRP